MRRRWSPVDGQIFFLYSAAAGTKAKAAQHQKLHQHFSILLPLLARQHLALKLGKSCPRGHWLTAVGGCSRVESEPASSLPGQTLPMGAGESWALQGKPGGRKIAKSQNIELSIVDNSPDDNSMIGLRELDTGLVAGTKQDHCTG